MWLRHMILSKTILQSQQVSRGTALDFIRPAIKPIILTHASGRLARRPGLLCLRRCCPRPPPAGSECPQCQGAADGEQGDDTLCTACVEGRAVILCGGAEPRRGESAGEGTCVCEGGWRRANRSNRSQNERPEGMQPCRRPLDLRIPGCTYQQAACAQQEAARGATN